MLEFILLSNVWTELAKLCLPAAITLAGVLLTIRIMNNNNRKQLQMKLREIEITYENKLLEIETSVGRVVLPRALEAIQGAFYHIRRINETLDAAQIRAHTTSLKKDVDYTDLIAITKTAIDWYDRNSFFLPNSVRNDFLVLTNKTAAYVSLAQQNFKDETAQSTRETLYKMTGTMIENVEKFSARFNLIDKTWEESIKGQ